MTSPPIMRVVDYDLCIGCGLCSSLCPHSVLTMQWNRYGEYNPVEEVPCTIECGLCLKVCPFADHEENEDTIGGRLYAAVPDTQHRSDTGYYIAAYVGYSEKHRPTSASGGMATWLLEKLLKEKIVDHIICVAPNNNPEKLFSFEVFNTLEEVRTGAGSVYYPVEMSKVVKYVLETPGRYAIIGLPCFIKAIRLAQIKNKILNERIIVTLGLVCGQIKSTYFTDYIASLAGVKGKVVSVRYRCKDPDQPASNFCFIFTDVHGEEKKIFWNDGISEAWVNRWFTPNACNYCDDIFAECADVVCMDAWLPEYSQDCKGTSLILVRSAVITHIIDNSIRSQEIFLNKLPIERLIKSQEGLIAIKRQHLANRLYLDRQNGWILPQKRVTPTRIKNPLLQREIILQEQMRMLSRDIWDPKEPDLEQFIKVMQPYLKNMMKGKTILNVAITPLRIIGQAIRRSRDE